MEEVVAAFEEDMQRAFENNVGEDDLLERILAVILLLFILGADYESEADFTAQDRAWLDEMYKMSVAAAPGIVNRNDGEFDMAPTASRLKHHVMGAYHYAYMVHGMNGDTMYTWELGEADHCGDCVSYAAMGPMPGEYWAQIATERGHYPQSPMLECKGLHCPCTMGAANG